MLTHARTIALYQRAKRYRPVQIADARSAARIVRDGFAEIVCTPPGINTPRWRAMVRHAYNNKWDLMEISEIGRKIA